MQIGPQESWYAESAKSWNVLTWAATIFAEVGWALGVYPYLLQGAHDFCLD